MSVSDPSRAAGVRHLLSAAIRAAVCGAIGGVLLVAGARWILPAQVTGSIGDAGWTGRGRAWFESRGFQGAEVDQAAERQYSWTSGRARLAIPELPRGIAYRLTLDINAFRLDDQPLPTVTVSVDGQPAATAQTTIDRQLVSVDLPPRASRGVVVTIEPSATFVPGPSDTRELGVMVNDVRLEPVDGHFRPSWTVLGLTVLATTLWTWGLFVCAPPLALAVPVAGAIAGGVVWLLLLDAAFLGDDVLRLVWIGGGVAAIGMAVALVREQWPGVADASAQWPAAVGGVAAWRR